MPPHLHPCNFRLTRHFDRGWGEIAFEYHWDSTGGHQGADGLENTGLAYCFLYELTRYEACEGTEREGFFFPPDPPFLQWKFRNPTDGRTGPVGMERFAAAQGWAWDRHKLSGRLALPENSAVVYRINSRQEYRFHCELCGEDTVVPGPDAGPHTIMRTFALNRTAESGCIWRYEIVKHGICAWMDWGAEGYVTDSAGLGFGPW